MDITQNNCRILRIQSTELTKVRMLPSYSEGGTKQRADGRRELHGKGEGKGRERGK